MDSDEDKLEADVDAKSESEDDKHDADSDEEPEPTSRAKGKKMQRSTAPAKKNAQPKRGKYSKVKSGMKWCRACHKTLPLDKFPMGSSDCIEDKVAVQNLAGAAKAQGKLDWWKSVLADNDKLKAIVVNYHARCPRTDKKKRATFPIVDWIEEARQESQILTDGVYEMMDQRAYQYHKGKPKNGGMDAEEAKQKWNDLCGMPGAITDNLGECEKYLRRVCVKVKDMVIIRDAKIESRGYRASNLEAKKATADDIARVQNRLARGTSSEDFGADRINTAGIMMGGRAAGNEGASAFTSSGRSAMNIGDVQELEDSDKSDVENAEDNAEDKESALGGSEDGSGKSKTKVVAKNVKKPWFNADEKISAAIKSHEEWFSKTKHECVKLLKDMKTATDAVTSEIAGSCSNEVKILETRRNALKLVLGGHREDLNN